MSGDDVIPKDEQHPARVTFEIYNVPLVDQLTCGPITLSPVSDIDAVLQGRSGFNPPPTLTGSGILALPNGSTPDDALAAFLQHGYALELLLSFAYRCHAQFVKATLELYQHGAWRERTWIPSVRQDGFSVWIPWFKDRAELDRFLDAAYPKLIDPAFRTETAMDLVLDLARRAKGAKISEMTYLETWIAFETLYCHGGDDDQILPDDHFTRVRGQVSRLLRHLSGDLAVGSAQRRDINEKLGELNRPSARRQIRNYLARVLATYPTLQPTDEELQAFIRIRNAITHGGTAGAVLKADYDSELELKTKQLRALLDRAVIARLGAEADVMDTDWRDQTALVYPIRMMTAPTWSES